jgi:ACS family hexuronate transporter-like MFS transporter
MALISDPVEKKQNFDLSGQALVKSSYRWAICILLFFATTINYIDRNVLGLLKPMLQIKIGWTEAEYGLIIAAFTAAYALGQAFFGRIIDKFGTKLSYSITVFIWSLAAMGHAVVRTPFGFGVARASLGIGESGNFPAAIKSIAEWFPKKERAFATGIFNSGANIGAVFAPIVVPWLTLTYGWQSAFIVTGAFGFIWLIFWYMTYERPEIHKKVNKKELEYILSDREEAIVEKISWTKLLTYKQTWAFVIGKFLTDPIWWFYLYWLPGFLNQKYKLDLSNVGWPLIIIYTMTSIGSIGGGWLSGKLIGMGWSINKSRKFVMLVCAILIVPIVIASKVSLWTSVGLIGLAAACHQGWSANIFTTASDMFPKKAVGSIVGLGGTAGALGGVLFQVFTGFILQFTGSYFPLFIISGSAYLIAILIFHLLVPRMEIAKI